MTQIHSIPDLSYVITPFFAWLITGISKFIINSIKAKRLAFDLIGYGGMPSNHSAIVSSAVVIIWLNEGVSSPALVVALALAFVVMLDAKSLRNQVGKHAVILNQLRPEKSNILRERIGHARKEIAAGCFTGAIAAYIIHIIFS